MKTSYSIDYLQNKYGPREAHEFVIKHRKRLEAKTGARWTVFHAHGRFMFTPIFDHDQSASEDEELIALTHEGVRRIPARPTSYVRLDTLHRFVEAQADRPVTLPEVIAAVKTLSRRCLVTLDVSRTSNAAAYVGQTKST